MLDAASCHFRDYADTPLQNSFFWPEGCCSAHLGTHIALCHHWGLSADLLILIPILPLHGFPQALADPSCAALRGGCGLERAEGAEFGV